MLIKYQIRNNFQTTTAQTVLFSGVTNTYKSINIPINTEFFPIDNGETIQNIVSQEEKNAINPTFDGETIKYTFNNISANSNQGLLVQFNFWNASASTYDISYSATGFTTLEVNKNMNVFKQSFFRLYFYDSNSGDTNNLIFTEDINVFDTTKPIIPFNRLYWLRNDDYFVKNNTNRTVYMDARFFNAKTGKVNRFINPNLPATPLSVISYSDPNNRSWRTSEISIINPKLNNGNYNFNPIVPSGANTPMVITLSEFIMQ